MPRVVTNVRFTSRLQIVLFGDKDLRYVRLEERDFDTVYDTFVKAFSDYQIEIGVTRGQFREMNLRRGLKYELSVGALDDSGKMVGLILNGVDVWEGRLSAYDMGTGVIPEFRRKGVAGEMFEFLVPKLRREGVNTYLLEVITSNQKAYDLYKKKGFKETRQFECFTAETTSLNLKSAKNAEVESISIKPAKQADWSLYETFWDWLPSWQNSINSMKRSPGHKIILEAFKGSTCVGYAILYPDSGDIAQLAIDKAFRRTGIGSMLVKALSFKSNRGKLSVINVDRSSADTLNFLTHRGFRNFAGQYEMILEL